MIETVRNQFTVNKASISYVKMFSIPSSASMKTGNHFMNSVYFYVRFHRNITMSKIHESRENVQLS